MQLNYEADGTASRDCDPVTVPPILPHHVGPRAKPSFLRRVVRALKSQGRDVEVSSTSDAEQILVAEGGRQAVTKHPQGDPDGGKAWRTGNPVSLAPVSPEVLANRLLKYLQPESETIRSPTLERAVDNGRTEGLTNPERGELLRLRRENRMLRDEWGKAMNAVAWLIVTSGATPKRRPRSPNVNREA